jgi:hypothetical protein
MLSVIDELLMYINLRACSTGSVNTEPNFGRVEISDSLKKDIDEYQSMIDMLQR